MSNDTSESGESTHIIYAKELLSKITDVEALFETNSIFHTVEKYLY